MNDKTFETRNEFMAYLKTKDYAKGGRPLFDGKNVDVVLQKLEEAFAYDTTDEEACSYTGISTTAFYEFQKMNPWFLERKRQLKNMPVLQARQSVVTALAKDPDLALKYLERKKRKEFATRTEKEVKEVSEFDDMSDEDLDKIINATSTKTS